MDHSVEHDEQKAHNELVLSFLSVRRCVGALGFFLPVALLLYALLTGEGLRLSISGYYFSPMREIFVGTLLALAVFLWSYEGFREPERLVTDKLVARIAAVSAALVALCPTSPGEGESKAVDVPIDAIAAQGRGALDCLRAQVPVPDHLAIDNSLMQCLLPTWGPLVHAIAAVVFFGALAVFCLVLFMRGKDTLRASEQERRTKQAEYLIYRICGWTIIICIVLIAFLWITRIELKPLRPVFWLETIACFAFATSWAVKGDALRALVTLLRPGP